MTMNQMTMRAFRKLTTKKRTRQSEISWILLALTMVNIVKASAGITVVT